MDTIRIDEKSRPLFMKYALPCAGTLVSRGRVSQEKIDSLIDIVKKGEHIPKDSEKIFTVAFTACSLIALDKKKDIIDESVIRDYFLFRHDDIIDKRFEEMGDFDPEACRTRIGTVLSAEMEKANILTGIGPRDFRTDFCDIHENDTVVTHWDFIVEKVDREMAQRIAEMRKMHE